MRALIYLSAIFGITLISIKFAGWMMDEPVSNYYLYCGILILILLFIPLILIEIILYKNKMRRIIDSSNEKTNEPKKFKNQVEANKWGMNNSPFRDRRSGLIWGGGNIKGANAKRVSRKHFLK